jgi:hypothetical protein
MSKYLRYNNGIQVKVLSFDITMWIALMGINNQSYPVGYTSKMGVDITITI